MTVAELRARRVELLRVYSDGDAGQRLAAQLELERIRIDLIEAVAHERPGADAAPSLDA